jgi:hypothetical protein
MDKKLLAAAALAGLCAFTPGVLLAQSRPNGERTNQQQGQSSQIQQNTSHPSGLKPSGNSRLEDIRRTASGDLTLTDDQRARIRDAVAHAHLHRQNDVGFTITVGAAVPQQAQARDLPPKVAKAVPAKHRLQYVLVRDQLVLLDKQTRRIVAIVPGMG